MYLKFLANSFGYRAAAMSGRMEPRSKAKHDHAFERHKKARHDLHPRLVSRPTGGLLEQPLVVFHSTNREIAVLPMTQA